MVVGNMRPGGDTLIFAYICMLQSFFGFKISNYNIFKGFQKNDYFLGYEDFVDFFFFFFGGGGGGVGSSQSWTIFWGHFYAF